MLVFPFGYQSYLSQINIFSKNLAEDINSINTLFQYAVFHNKACNDQEVYYVSEDKFNEFEALKLKLKSYLSSKNKIEYQLARLVELY